ncbi:MAG: FtsX-like permease family protein [Deltaproteobacteria bacterium]|nr:FtsX-like permease family protein [Deltaproteobacteria bacterium]
MIGLGIALAAASLLANHALRDGFERSIDALAGRASLEIVARGEKAFDGSLLDRVREIPGVAAAASLLNEGAFLDVGEGPAVRVIGVDMLDEGTMRVYERAESDGGSADGIDDPLVFLNQPDSVLVPASLAREQELELGSPLVVRTPTGRIRLRVRGILADRGPAEAFAGRVLVMDLFSAQERFAAEGLVHQIDVRAAAGEDVEALAQRIEAGLPDGLVVRDPAERKALFGATVAGFHDLLDVMGAMALLLAIVVASNRLATIYQSRLVELGVLRAIGADPGSLVRGLCLEAGIVGVLAAAIGFPLGVLLAQGIVEPLAHTMELNFKKATAAPWVSPALGPLALAGAAGVLSALAAAWLPARRATRRAVRAVLTGDREDVASGSLESEAARRRRLRVRIAVLVLAAVLFCAQVRFALPWLGGPVMAAALVVGALLLAPALDLADAALSRFAGPSARIGLRRRAVQAVGPSVRPRSRSSAS